tara:strand:+ start:7262 stop:7660 length:399 start_codon:yes stop_codon:yes gene_type:complete
MSDKNVINIEDSEDVQKRARQNKRKEEIIKLIMRQTDYTKEQCEEKLLEWNNNYLNVIKEYINPDFYKKQQKNRVYNSRNQGIMTEIRGFMDNINKEYYRKKEAGERYKKFLQQQHFRKQAENTKINDISNN